MSAVKKQGTNSDLALELLLVLILILLVAYSLAYRAPLLYNAAVSMQHHVQLPANLTTNSGLNQSISDLNSLPGH